MSRHLQGPTDAGFLHNGCKIPLSRNFQDPTDAEFLYNGCMHRTLQLSQHIQQKKGRNGTDRTFETDTPQMKDSNLSHFSLKSGDLNHYTSGEKAGNFIANQNGTA